MTVGIEAAGDLATGALIGRAFEPKAGEGHGDAHGMCLNCGTALIGSHCHRCGQAGHVHRTIGAIGHELAHGVFHFEGKIWRTIPMLVLHPGALTRRYVEGERARFVSPLALFLFTVFLLFATISAVGGEFDGIGASADRTKALAKVERKLASAQAKLNDARAAAAKSPGNAEARDAANDAQDDVNGLNTAKRALQSAKAPGDRDFTFTDVKTGWPRLDAGIDKANKNPGLALYKLQSSAYKYSWALIPLSTPFVALLFLWRRRFNLYDHAIFVTYSLAFMMLLVTTLTLLGAAGLSAGWITAAVFFIPPVHMFAQLRGAYSLRKRSALWRTIMLLAFSFTALIAFMVLLLLHGLTE